MLNISLFDNFFEKNGIFRENSEKQFWCRFDNCLGKRGVLSPKLIWLFFYHKWSTEYFIVSQFFQKKLRFLRKWQKTVSGAQVSFEAKAAFGDENENNHFLWWMRFWIFFHLTIFLKKKYLLKKKIPDYGTDRRI